MVLHLFKNGTCALNGADLTKIVSEVSGTLKIGSHEFNISPETPVRLPMLTDRAVRISFMDGENHRYETETRIKSGKLVPSSLTDTEIALMHRMDELETTVYNLCETVSELSSRYSNETLGFLIDD